VTDLKPCPFCGNEPLLVTHSSDVLTEYSVLLRGLLRNVGWRGSRANNRRMEHPLSESGPMTKLIFTLAAIAAAYISVTDVGPLPQSHPIEVSR
jgi:hypothetical protein